MGTDGFVIRWRKSSSVAIPAAAAFVCVAGMPLFMVVVVAMGIRVIDQTTCQIICYYVVRIAGNAAKQLDACLSQCGLRTGTDAAAENDVDSMLEQEADQCAVALPVGGNDLTAEDAAVFDFIELELRGMAEVLKHLPVFVRNCDFHF